MRLLPHLRCIPISPIELYCHYRYFHVMGRHNKAANKRKTNAPKKPQLTHFLCVPLVNSISQPQLEASIGNFKEHVCSNFSVKSSREVGTAEASNDSPLHPDAIRPVGSLHLTLGVMSLDEGKLAQATTLLQSLDLGNLLREAVLLRASQIDSPDISNTTPDSATSTPLATDQSINTASTLESLPLTLSLESLEPMQSPTKTSILYIRPHDPTNRLEPLCQALRKTFTEAGFLVPDTRPLRLHATIVNTIFIKGRKKNKKKPKAAATEGNQDGVKTTEPSLPPSTNVSDKEDGLQANTPNSGHGPSAESSLYLDATSLLSTYKSHIWASDISISKIAICEMGVKKQFSPTGEVVGEAYHEVAFREI
jgi:activating signal cointegrator complex subunit 1